MASHIKTEISPPPPLLGAFENHVSPRRCLVVSALIGLVWLGLGVGDWFMRFHWFGWHRDFIVRTVTAPADGVARTVTNSPLSGGDLSSLAAFPSAVLKYQQERPAATNHFDSFGFRNVSPLLKHYPVVVVGDSYSTCGPCDEDTLPSQLASILGVPVYDHAMAGRGTFWAIVRFFASERFRDNEPRVLIWPVIEREIAGGYFEGGLYQVLSAKSGTGTAGGSGIDWGQLNPKTLHQNLPNTSAFGLLSSRIWNRARYAMFGQLNPVVTPSACDAAGGPMLFYTEALMTERWSDDQRSVSQLVHASSNLTAAAQQRGMSLLFVLVPDKERIYSDALPEYARQNVRPTVLPDVEQRFRAAGLKVVNLLPAFQSAAQHGELLYWRDDTHWDPAGVRLAAQIAAPEVRRLLNSP